MAAPPVPASTAIRASRVANIDTDRLVRRQAFLVGLFDTPHPFDRRRGFAERARELHAIENMLHERGVLFTRRTVRFQPNPT